MEYLSEILSFIGGAGISFAITAKVYSIKIKKIYEANGNSSQKQDYNTVIGGSIVGGDQHNHR